MSYLIKWLKQHNHEFEIVDNMIEVFTYDDKVRLRIKCLGDNKFKVFIIIVSDYELPSNILNWSRTYYIEDAKDVVRAMMDITKYSHLKELCKHQGRIVVSKLGRSHLPGNLIKHLCTINDY